MSKFFKIKNNSSSVSRSRFAYGSKFGSSERDVIPDNMKITAQLGQGCSTGAGGQNNYEQDYYNPVRDRLDRGTVMEEWMPHSQPALNRMFRNLYARDNVAGPAVDIWSMLPWSEWIISGISDPFIKRFYEEALQTLFTPTFLEELSKEYLVIGRFCGNLAFDEKKGYWTDIIANDPDFLEIRPVPVMGWDPLIDLRASPGLMDFIFGGNDPRVAFIQETIGDKYMDILSTRGMIPLEPLNTLWVARQVSPYDKVGTSFLTRVLPLWAIEKPLLNATLVSARRKAGSILHLTVDSDADSGGPPDPNELHELAGLFMQANTDPVGSIIATRSGINANEVGSGGDIWKISDEESFLTSAKMRALAINESFLSGDATYNNYDEARSVFMEQLRSFRALMTQKTIIKYAERLARVHGFVKRSNAELDHNIRVKNTNSTSVPYPYDPKDLGSMSYSEGMKLNSYDLILPDVQWSKSLKPEGDHRLLDILETLQDNGVPVPVRTWANLGGLNLDNLMQGLPEDLKIKKVINKYKEKVSNLEEGGEGDDKGGGKEESMFGSVENYEDEESKTGDALLASIYEELDNIGFNTRAENKEKTKKIKKNMYNSRFLSKDYKTKENKKEINSELVSKYNNFIDNSTNYSKEIKELLKRSVNLHSKIPVNSPNLVSGN